MPKRTREQQDKHNENRRKVKKEGKKATLCMKYIGIKYPKIYDEVNKLHDIIRALYPGKRDLSTTPEFTRCVQDENVKNNMLQPILEIPLLSKQTTSTIKETTQNDKVEEIPLTIDATDEEIETMIAELREDPDLVSFFNDFHFEEITVETTVETSSLTTQIDQIIDEEFKTLGENFPDIIDNEDQLLW